MGREAVLLVGHGSRDPQATREFEQLVAAYRQRRPELVLAHAYLGLVRPAAEEAVAVLAGIAEAVLLVPLFLFSGGHLTHDLPRLVERLRRSFPTTRFAAAGGLGLHPAMVQLACLRAEAALAAIPARAERAALLVVGHDSSEPDARSEFARLVVLIREHRRFAAVAPHLLGRGRPDLEVAVTALAHGATEIVMVLPYLLFSGRLLSRLRNSVADLSPRFPGIKVVVAPHLGLHERVLEVLDARLAAALTALRSSRDDGSPEAR
ncbi:MAG: sirohydrochlorin chelatase [Candidatus Tectomicrobia bacterium]|nr:sirohydrochlorin chelatase [Candidatus Tectomicrobia bacterium]